MSSEVKFKEHSIPEKNLNKGKVNVTNLVNRLNLEKKKERNTDSGRPKSRIPKYHPNKESSRVQQSTEIQIL